MTQLLPPERCKPVEGVYVCVDIDEAAPQTGYLGFFEKDGTPMGDGILHWDAGTNLNSLPSCWRHHKRVKS